MSLSFVTPRRISLSAALHLGVWLAATAAVAIPDEAPPATLCNLVRDGGRYAPVEDLRIPANAVIGDILVYTLNVFDTTNPTSEKRR